MENEDQSEMFMYRVRGLSFSWFIKRFMKTKLFKARESQLYNSMSIYKCRYPYK